VGTSVRRSAPSGRRRALIAPDLLAYAELRSRKTGQALEPAELLLPNIVGHGAHSRCAPSPADGRRSRTARARRPEWGDRRAGAGTPPGRRGTAQATDADVVVGGHHRVAAHAAVDQRPNSNGLVNVTRFLLQPS